MFIEVLLWAKAVRHFHIHVLTQLFPAKEALRSRGLNQLAPDLISRPMIFPH